MEAITHLEKVIVGEVSAVTHLEKVIAGETSAVTYTEKVITSEATPITHLQKVIAGVESPVTHLEYVWAGRTPEPTEHEYTGSVPVTINANGSPLISLRISGNTAQSGTPTPDSPIMPEGTGERTGNLLPEFYATSGKINGNSYTITKNSIETHNDGSVLGSYYILTEFKRYGNYANYSIIDEKHSFKIPAGTYTFSANENIHSNKNGLCLIVGQLGQTAAGASAGAINIGVGQTFTVDVDSYVCPVLEIRYDSHVDEYILTNPMLNLGSTALPYEPYGYKLDISSASTTTPVYLGEVETTRKIKKYEFTGQESIVADLTYSRFSFTLNDSLIIGVRKTPAFCTHWQVIDDGRPIANVPNNALYSDSVVNSRWFIKTTDYTTVDDFKTYLAQQYAAGTPVTVWYVLASETTGIVNEPIRKIGDYADTLSMEQAGVSIPTNNGSTTVDVETTLKPSEVYIKYKGV